MEQLEDLLGYHFQDHSLLDRALTHSSYINEHHKNKLDSNERMEFLGDSVLGLVVADHLYHTHPDLPEGELTRIRANLVCEKSLYQVAQKLNLGSYLKLGHGEVVAGGRERPSLLADATEAVLASVYLDGGIEPVKELIEHLILENEESNQETRDFKTCLQELVQKKAGQTLSYKLTGESGPDHAKTFSVSVVLNGQEIGSGQGRTKKAAEQEAARDAIDFLGED